MDDESARSEAYKIELIMKQAKITPNDRPVVPAALSLAQTIGAPAAAWSCPMERSSWEKQRSFLEPPLLYF